MKSILFFAAIMLPSIPLLQAEQPTPAKKTPQRVAFAQYCFWTGEMNYGQIEGVVRTEAGYFQGHEVTLVEFDPARISLAQLASQGKKAGVADRIYLLPGQVSAGAQIAGVTVGPPLDQSYRRAPASDQKKQLEGTPYARLSLTPEQATKVNAFARTDPAKAREWLAPAQRATLASSR